MALRFYNTLTRTVEPFEPIAPPAVTMYVCGPTVYDDPHIGHARSAYIFDVLRRYLAFKQFQVRFVRNVTDVDDKIIQKASETGGSSEAVAKRYLARYHETMDRLGIGRPTEEPRATQHVVPDMTDFIAKLLISGVAYEAGGDVYFAVRKFPEYGRLSNRKLDELQAGARVEPGEQKKDPLDFALWKAAKPGEPSWNSPWGKGRPGWHIECSTMSTKYLGDAFDIHGGGVDLVFPHHENEIAQAQAAGKPFARCWVHNGLLTVKGEKMSKSLGNYLTLDQIFKDYQHPDYLKMLFLKTHYRSPVDYTPAKMEEAKKNWDEFLEFFDHYDQFTVATHNRFIGKQVEQEVPNFEKQFQEAMDEDLNTPEALAVLFEAVNLGKQGLQHGDAAGGGLAAHAHWTLLACGNVLGLFQQGMSHDDAETRLRLQKLIQEREIARKSKNFVRADEIRQQLRTENVHITDTPVGPLWRRIQ